MISKSDQIGHGSQARARDTPGRRRGARHPGPPLGAPAVASTATLLAAVLLGPLTGAGPIPSPYSSTATLHRYLTAHARLESVSAFLLVLSATSFVVLSAIVWSRLAFLAPNAPGPALAGFGGIFAGGLLGLSALLTWVMSRRVVIAEAPLAHALHYLAFAAGGPAHVAALGIMCLGIAVTALFLRRTPRVLSFFGLALAALDLAASLAFVLQGATPLVPIGRFTSLVWLVTMCLMLPRERAARRAG